jgi:hypothetical protein
MQPRIIKVSDYSDKQLFCVDCGCAFTWTAPEQAFYKSKGFSTQPKRCKPCLQYRKLCLVVDDRPSALQAVRGGERHDS